MEKRFWNETNENMTRDELRDLQWKKLTRQMLYIYDHSSYFKKRFDDLGAHPADIKTIDAFRELPIFMDKQSDRETQEIS